MHGTNGLRDLSGAAFSHFGGYTQFGRPGTFTEMAADVESGVHDADSLFALTGVPCGQSIPPQAQRRGQRLDRLSPFFVWPLLSVHPKSGRCSCTTSCMRTTTLQHAF